MTIYNSVSSIPQLCVKPTLFSPIDFSVTYTGNNTITASGAPITIDSTTCVICFVLVTPSGKYESQAYINGLNGITITASSNVITVRGVNAPFASGDSYVVGVASQIKGYVQASDSFRFYEIDPLDLKVVEESLVDTTNVTTQTFYPSSDGMQMLGYADLSLTGKLIQGDAVETKLTVWGTNDEDTTPANRDWVYLYGYNWGTNATVSGITANASTSTFAWQFSNLNFKYVRCQLDPGDATNTVIIKARRKAL